MRKPRKTKEQVLSSTPTPVDAMYVSWDGALLEDQADRMKAFAKLNEAAEEYTAFSRTAASFSYRRSFNDLATDTHGRPGLTRRDYEAFRPDEAVPTKIKDIQATADGIYHRVGIVRNIFDLMGDFTCQGVRVVHPNKAVEKFMRQWWHQVGGDDRSERIANTLYRLGTVVIKTQTAKLSKPNQKKMQKSMGAADMDVEFDKVVKREIPWKYVLIDPVSVDIVGGPISAYVNKPLYAIKLPEALKRLIKSPKSEAEKEIVNKLPADIKKAAQTHNHVLLDPDKTTVLSYKKDDWQSWAFPMIYAIMDDIFVLEKLRLADVAALDGAISNIRIFKLGNLEHSLAPTAAAAAKLAGILQSHTGVGTLDMIWGPDIELLETKTSVHQFLGSSKYEPTLNAIHAGLGVPQTLTGIFGSSGTTNNFVALQTLINRLEYGRSILRNFWHNEFVKVQKALGFKAPARLEFDHPNLGDTQAAMSLLVQLADRNLVSDELLREAFQHDPEMEKIRINRETRDREAGRDVPKAGAFHDPQFNITLKKVFAQTGAITPSQSGLDLPAPKDGEQPAIKMKPPIAGGKPGEKKAGVSGQGRPKNSNDKTKRKTKRFTPKSKAVVEIWAGATQDAISEFLNPYVLENFDKKNRRQLTASEHAEAELIKFNVLWNHEPLGEVSEQTVMASLSSATPNEILDYRDTLIKTCSQNLGRKLNLNEIRAIQSATYASYYGDDENG